MTMNPAVHVAIKSVGRPYVNLLSFSQTAHVLRVRMTITERANYKIVYSADSGEYARSAQAMPMTNIPIKCNDSLNDRICQR